LDGQWLLLADFSLSQTNRVGKPLSAAFGCWSQGIHPHPASRHQSAAGARKMDCAAMLYLSF
jgi:hypothetical protein